MTLGTTANGTIELNTDPGLIQFCQWQHIATTVNATTGAAKAYINGQEVTFPFTIGSTISGQLNDASSHFIGQRQAANPDPRYYKGLIDEPSIYNRELSASGIQAIFNAGSAGKCLAATAAEAQITGQVMTARGRGIAGARVSLTDSSGEMRTVATNFFGYYRLTDVRVGETYILSVSIKRYQFQPQVIFVTEETEDFDFTALP